MEGLQYSPVKNHIIPLSSLLQSNKESIDLVTESLLTRGYSFIRLSADYVKIIDSCMESMDTFFSKPLYYKEQYFKEPIFGYYGVDHKESFRLLTGMRLAEHKFPKELSQLKTLVNATDRVMYTLALRLSPTLFPNLLIDAKKLDIPLLNTKNQWGMFDIAKYHNSGLRTELNCKEHYDPGLLSLSLRSSQPGLQLRDEFNRWIKPPEDKNVAILWAGKAAVDMNRKIKPGVHRVVNPDNLGVRKPRIAMWHEICTSAQEHRELIKDDKYYKDFKKMVMDPRKFESETGIPTSKSMR